MSEKKIKGSFIGGYSKKEVNQFISDMSMDFKRQSDEKNATIEFERSRAEKAEEELKLANAKLDEIALMAYNAEQRQKELEKRISDLEKNRVILSDKLDEMAISAQTAITDLEETRKRFEQECLKNEFNEEKLDALACETYEMMRQSRASDDIYLKIDQKIEEIFKEADEKATEIIKRAQAIADELVNETKEKTKYYRANLEDSYKNAITEYKENVNAAVDNLLRTVSEGSNELNHRIDSVENIDNAPRNTQVTSEGEQEQSSKKTAATRVDYISSLNEKIEKFFKGAINALNSLISKK